MIARRPVVATALIAAFAVAILAGFVGADAHSGHTQKKLFPARWYDTTEFLETSFDSPVALTCDSNFSVCAGRWTPPIFAALIDWNNQTMTPYFHADTNYDENEDVVVRVMDVVLGEPDILGIALTWAVDGPDPDSNADFCPLTTCGIFRWGEAWIGDDGHAGVYGTATVRQATLAHELGHLLSLRHESVNFDESILYECLFDDTGSIPASIMSYDCIDPPAVGGSGIYLVQPFDVCGVNHAYFEAGIGYVGCPAVATPTPTPSPTPIAAGPNAWGNVDCGGGIGAVDSLKLLRFGAGLSVLQTEPCPNVATELHVSGWLQGDVDCLGTVNSVDALKILRFAASLSVNQGPGCPLIGAAF